MMQERILILEQQISDEKAAKEHEKEMQIGLAEARISGQAKVHNEMRATLAQKVEELTKSVQSLSGDVVARDNEVLSLQAPARRSKPPT